jgi:glyoxylase I family protein
VIIGIHHTAIGVDDLETALVFYRDALGFEVVQESSFSNRAEVDAAIGLKGVKARMAMMKGPNAFIELWEYASPPPEDRRSRPCDLGYPHIALQVADIESEYQRLQAAGMSFVGDIVHFGDRSSAIYGHDPCGNIIELYEIRTGETAGLTDFLDLPDTPE